MLRTIVISSCFLAVTTSTTAADTRIATAESRRDARIQVEIARCNGGEASRCFDAADDIERYRVATTRDEHTPQELRARGQSLLARDCERGDATACLEYSELLRAARRFDRALETLNQACELDSAEACLTLGNRARDAGRNKKNVERALTFFDRACKAGSTRGCVNLADELRVSARANGFAIEKLYRKACQGDDATGCVRSAESRALAGDRDGAYLDFARACMLKEGTACFNAGTFAPNPVRARWMFLLACEAEIAKGCSKLSDLLLTDAGGDRNWKKALEFAEQACTLDHVAPCKRAEKIRRQPPDWHCKGERECERLCREGLAKSCKQLEQYSDDIAAPALDVEKPRSEARTMVRRNRK